MPLRAPVSPAPIPPGPARRAGLLALAALLAAGPAAAGTPSVAPRCIALSVEGGHRLLTNWCRFAVDLRSCTSLGRRARCGRRLAEGSIAAGATLRIRRAGRDRLHYAACPFGDVFDTAWIDGGAGGFTATCLSVGD